MLPGKTQDALVLLFTKEEAFISHLPSDGYTAIQIGALILPKRKRADDLLHYRSSLRAW